MELSRTGEVGEFLDDNQFAPPGGSHMKCGPESISLCFHSVAPGQHNPWTSQDIHAMAHEDYVAFVVGPEIGNVPAAGGTTDPEFYQILDHHGMPYRKLPHDLSIIVEWLQHGYPVIIGGVREDTILDAGLNGSSPYDWDHLETRSHIITATGLGSRPDRLKFRDTANFRPGPREYFHERLNFSIATAIVPAWMPVPPEGAIRPPEGDDMLQLTDPFAQQYFKEIATTPVRRWQCKEPQHKHDVIGGILDFYRKIGGAPRLPTSDELRPNPTENVVYQHFEAGVIVYDPENKLPHPAGFQEAFLLMLTSDEVKKIVCG